MAFQQALRKFEADIEKTVSEFTTKVYNRYLKDTDVLLKDLLDIWNDLSNREDNGDDSDQENERRNSDRRQKQLNGCVYRFKRGKNKGQSCGKKLRDGYDYCAAHAAQVNKSNNQQSSETKLPPSRNPSTKVHLRKHPKIKQYWHEESGLVFADPTTNTVTGRVKNGRVIKLDSEGIELCKKYRLKYEQPDDFDQANDSEDEIEVDDSESESEQKTKKKSRSSSQKSRKNSNRPRKNRSRTKRSNHSESESEEELPEKTHRMIRHSMGLSNEDTDDESE